MAWNQQEFNKMCAKYSTKEEKINVQLQNKSIWLSSTTAEKDLLGLQTEQQLVGYKKKNPNIQMTAWRMEVHSAQYSEPQLECCK